MKKAKLFRRILGRKANIPFADALAVARAFGFIVARVQGSHHILKHPDIPEFLNLQDVGGQAKPYQIRQMLQVIERYDLAMEDEP